MISTSSIVLNSYVNFSCYAPAILGNGYQNAEVLAILDYATANIFIDAAVLHAGVYPSIQANGVPNDYTKYPYLKIRTASGQVTVVGLPWIVDASYVVETAVQITLTINSVSPADQNNIKLALAAIGITSFIMAVGAAPAAPVSPTPTPAPTGGTSSTSPVASFNYVLNGLQVTFTDTSVDAGGITAWNWDFGDGSVATLQNPAHTYAAAGTYSVQLTITDGNDDSYLASATVTVS